MIEKRRLAAGSLTVLLFYCHFSHGRLGEDETSIKALAKSLGAKRVVREMTGYRVHEMSVEGRTVREFVGPDGKVFAATWQGQLPPDLKSIFGNYYTQYEMSRAKMPRARGRGPIHVETEDLVVEHGGHVRDIRGAAYVKSLLPKDFKLEDLR